MLAFLNSHFCSTAYNLYAKYSIKNYFSNFFFLCRTLTYTHNFFSEVTQLLLSTSQKWISVTIFFMTKQWVKLSWRVILQSQVPIRIEFKKCKLSLTVYNVLCKDILFPKKLYFQSYIVMIYFSNA